MFAAYDDNGLAVDHLGGHARGGGRRYQEFADAGLLRGRWVQAEGLVQPCTFVQFFLDVGWAADLRRLRQYFAAGGLGERDMGRLV